MKLAVLGTGMIVKEVLPVLQKIEGIDLVAILSTVRSLETAKDLAKEYNMSLATSEYKAVLDNEEIDTVYIGLRITCILTMLRRHSWQENMSFVRSHLH